MDVGLDGSLCRLTNSWGDGTCNVKIVQVCEGGEIDFKLVLLDVKENDRVESVSDKSDEEPWTLESLDIELGILNPEKGQDKKTEEDIAGRPKNTVNKPFHRRHRSNNPNRYRMNYNGSPGQRNFKSYNNNGKKSYNRKTANTDSNDISPWLEPPQILNNRESFQFPNFPTQFVPISLDSSMNTAVTSNIDSPANPLRSRGILGDSPFDRSYKQPNFQASTNANNFSRNSNYWNAEYSNSYQHPVQNAQMRGKAPYKRHHNQIFWKNGPTSYNRNQDKNQRRRGRGGRFNNYRQQ